MDFDFDFGLGPEPLVHPTGGSSIMDELASRMGILQLDKENHVVDIDSVVSPVSPTEALASSATSIRSASTAGLYRPSSKYWSVPDPNQYLTALAVRNDSLCAVASGSQQNNLFVYEVDPECVTHHQTISLPEVHSLSWASPESKLGKMGNVLVSGHKNGTAHLMLLPDATSRDPNSSAEIMKRYNHSKHLPAGFARNSSLRIRNLELTSSAWTCCADSSLFTLCGDHLFLWEPNRSDVPLVMQKTRNTNCIGLCNSREGVYALGRKRGVSIRDIRVRDRTNAGLKPPVDNDEQVSLVKWNPFDGGNMVAAVHDRTTVKVWDIRNNSPVASYTRHADTVNAVEWTSVNELVTASSDGTVRVWGLEEAEVKQKPEQTDELDTVYHDYLRRQRLDDDLELFANDLLSSVPSVNDNRHFLGLGLATMGPGLGAVSIDSGGYLGVHQLEKFHSGSYTKHGSGSFSSVDSISEHRYFSHF